MLDSLLLVATILSPALAIYWLVMSFCGDGHDFRSKALSVAELHTEHGLIRQGLLWLAIGIPLSLGLAFGVWVCSGYEVSLNLEGYKKFVEISLLPLAIMSVSLPLAALVSRIHSTQQAARQIVLSRTKNNLDAYYAHRKAMFEYFKEIDETEYFNQYKFSYKAHPVLHKRFFLGSPEEGTPVMHEHTFTKVEQCINGAATFLIDVLSGSAKEPLAFYLTACSNIYHASKILNIKPVYIDMKDRGVFIRHNENEGATTFGVSTLETLAALRFTREYFNNLCDFSGRSRMSVSPKLDEVFDKTEFWLHKGKFIEELHEGIIANLVASGGATLGEKHHSLQTVQAG
ncbi:hypothetical protein V5F23_17215 [Pseudomonas sp. WP18]|uniref:hypothetical protein n=1 Tax=Pseudomonas sp. WP18 TaxID=3118752 RepID=UPI0030D01BC4